MYESVMSELPKYLNQQSLTLIGVLLGLFVAWKATVKGYGAVKGFLAKFNFALATATVLLVGGLSGLGYGVGDICNRPVEKSHNDRALAGISDDKLLDLAKNAKDETITKAILDYAKNRDSQNTQRYDARQTEKLASNVVIPASVMLTSNGTISPDPTSVPYPGLSLPSIVSIIGASLAALIVSFITFIRKVG